MNDLQKVRSEREPHLLIDVRSEGEYKMCHLSESVNLHISSLDKNADYLVKQVNDLKRITDDPKSKAYGVFWERRRLLVLRKVYSQVYTLVCLCVFSYLHL